MSDRSAIEWTEATWNPVRGCSKVSPGCTHCYAETFAERFRGVDGHPYEQGFDLRLVPEKLSEPLEWTRRRTVFVNSMSDLFHEAVPVEYIRAVAEVMRATPWHTYQVLTKRARRLHDLLNGTLQFAAELPNVWWGVSVENRKHGIPRIGPLQRTKVRLRFLSIEPLIEDLGPIPLDGIHWIIVGGESGHGARPMLEPWVIAVQRQAHGRSIPFFFKQWGGVHKSRAGRVLQDRTWDDMPPRSLEPVPSRDTRGDIRSRIDLRASNFSSGVLPQGSSSSRETDR